MAKSQILKGKALAAPEYREPHVGSLPQKTPTPPKRVMQQRTDRAQKTGTSAGCCTKGEGE